MKPHARTEKQAVDAADLQHEAGAPAAARSLPYETIALVLQGGGALGAYQAGVFEGLHEANVPLDWIAGISIGALNTALIAGNAPEHRVERLREFWETICQPAFFPAIPAAFEFALFNSIDQIRTFFTASQAASAMMQGQQGFFVPRFPPPLPGVSDHPEKISWYDTSALRATLLKLCDFDRINSGETRVSVGAVNVGTGNFVYFDNSRIRLTPEHFMASGALPPAFPPVEIDGEYYWDGGVVSNTPLEYVLESSPRRDTLALQVDLWSAWGILPRTLLDVLERQKDIQYSSRTRLSTDAVAARQKLRNTLALLLESIPKKHLPDALVGELQPWLCDRVFNIIHLIYRAKPYEEQFKDYAFGRIAMQEHWASGLQDMQRSLGEPAFFVPPAREIGVVTHDIHRGETAA